MSEEAARNEPVGPGQLLGYAALAFLATAPLALPAMATGWWWASSRHHTRRALWATYLCIGLGGVGVLVMFRHIYAAAWWEMWVGILGGKADRPLWMLVVVLALVSSPLGFALGAPGRWLWHLTRQRHPIKGRQRKERFDTAQRSIARRSAKQRADLPLTVNNRPLLGPLLDGDPLPRWRTKHGLVLPDDAAHIVAVGATGSGKTQTILRIIASHLAMGWRVVVIDAKEDPDTAAQFAQTACQHGVNPARVKLWPHTGPMDLLRGPAPAIANRLMASASWTEPYYKAVAGTLLTLACDDPAGPPRSLAELLQRLDPATLKTRWAGTTRAAIAAGAGTSDVQGVKFRYFTIAADLESVGAINPSGGGWSWEDADATWVTLPTSTRPDTAGTLGRALLVDLISYIRDPQRRTNPDQPILVVVEELGAIVSADPDTAHLVIEAVERARSAKVRAIVSVQTPEGLGDPNAQARILHGGAAVIAHRLPRPEAIVELAGSDYGLEASLGVTRSGDLLDHGAVREQHQYKVPPNRVRTLPVGEAVFIHEGHWAHTSIPMLPRRPLPLRLPHTR